MSGTEEGSEVRPLTPREWLCFAAAGAADYLERAPGQHCPDGDPLAPEVCAYWDGWGSAVEDAAAAYFRERRRAAVNAPVAPNLGATLRPSI